MVSSTPLALPPVLNQVPWCHKKNQQKKKKALELILGCPGKALGGAEGLSPFSKGKLHMNQGPTGSEPPASKASFPRALQSPKC